MGEMTHRAYADAMGYLGLTLQELEALPTLCEAQTADLKIESEDKTERVWLERTGEPFDNMVTVEFFVSDKWQTVSEYEAE
jgi:hypothetical protein